jgi:hypothetical protein
VIAGTNPFSSIQLQLFPARLIAREYIRRLRGGSQSQLLRASDGHYYATKFVGNPQHDRVLANELFASSLGQLLSLPVPEVSIIEVSEAFITRTPQLCVETVGGGTRPFSSGLHLASRFAGNPETDQILDYVPEELFPKVKNRAEFPRCLVLDKWISNADGRQAVFVKVRGGFVATFIDQGYAFNAGEWSFPDLDLHGVYYRNVVYRDVVSWDSFEPALTRAEEMEHQEIWECAAPIPLEWCGPEPGALQRLVEHLYNRRSKIRDLITAFRNSTRDPFPNWTGK